MDLREVTEFLKDFAGYIITALVIILVFTFIVSLQPIAGNSMSPTLEEGQVVIVTKLFNNYTRNDVVVLKLDSKYYVKRIIGLPGERIDYLNGILKIDNMAFKEQFLDESVVTSNFLFEDVCPTWKCPDGVIPDNMYLVLGDNRPESLDSRDPSFGLIEKKNIKGRVIFKIWPINNLGSI